MFFYNKIILSNREMSITANYVTIIYMDIK